MVKVIWNNNCWCRLVAALETAVRKGTCFFFPCAELISSYHIVVKFSVKSICVFLLLRVSSLGCLWWPDWQCSTFGVMVHQVNLKTANAVMLQEKHWHLIAFFATSPDKSCVDSVGDLAKWTVAERVIQRKAIIKDKMHSHFLNGVSKM